MEATSARPRCSLLSLPWRRAPTNIVMYVRTKGFWNVKTESQTLRVVLRRNLSQNAIGGSLPLEWGWERSFIQLVTLTLDGNRLLGYRVELP